MRFRGRLSMMSMIAFCQLGRPGPVSAQPQAPSSAPSAPASGAAAADPKWFEKLMAREADTLPERTLTGLEDAFKAQVSAEILAPPTKVEDSQYVTLGIGTQAPMECWLSPERDTAASLRSISEELFRMVEKTMGKVEARGIHTTDAGAVGSAPFLGLEWLYRVSTSAGARAGHVKHFAAVKNGRSIYCLHNEAGYRETFARVFRGLVSSVAFPGPRPSPYFVELHAVTLGERKIGFGRTAYERDAEGDTRIVDQTSMLLPVDPQTLQAADNYKVQFSTPEGLLLNATSTESENGELATRLVLDPVEGGGWRVKGRLNSKDFQSDLESRELQSDLGLLRAIRDLAGRAKPGEAVKVVTWSEDVDPTRPSEIEIRVDSVVEDGIAATMKMGGVAFKAVFDRTGSTRSVNMEMGTLSLVLRRAHVEGTVPAP